MTSVQNKDEATRRLRKRLLYVFRYGVLKEGLDVDSNGYVDINEAMQIPLLCEYSQEDVMNEIKNSLSYRKTNRFDWKEKNKKIYVRAAYLRNFEKSPFHWGTKVKTLMESSMVCVLDNLDMFDLEDFQDEYTIKLMIHRLKRKKAITNKALSVLFVPTLTRIELDGIFLTNNTLRLLWTQCPHLRGVSLKNCGYIVTNTVLTQLAKNLPNLEQLNLSQCAHLTDKCLPILSKRLPHLKVLHIAGVRSINPKSVHIFLNSAKELTFLDVYFMKTTREEHDSLMQCAKDCEVDLILRSSQDKNLEEDYSDEEGDEEEEEEEEEEEKEIENVLPGYDRIGGSTIRSLR